ncbi:MAG: hypothetical protein Q9174_000956, partial [Haloplaca sp. 1 TL-2023]
PLNKEEMQHQRQERVLVIGHVRDAGTGEAHELLYVARLPSRVVGFRRCRNLVSRTVVEELEDTLQEIDSWRLRKKETLELELWNFVSSFTSPSRESHTFLMIPSVDETEIGFGALLINRKQE